MLHRILLLICAPLCATLAPSRGWPADELRFRIRSPDAGVRSHAPIPVEIQIESFSPNLLEGRLLLTFLDSDHVIGHYRSSEMALTTGKKRFRLLLPPQKITTDVSLLTTRARFVGENLDVDLEEHEFRVPVYWKRSLVIGIAVPEAMLSSEGTAELARSLALEEYAPESVRSHGLETVLSRVNTDELPATPLEYTAYDLLLLPTEGLLALDSGQLAAIGQWVEAGGSVFVFPGPPLRPEHVQFLNDLAGRPIAFVAEGQGELLPPDDASNGPVQLYRPGLGRAAISRKLPTAEDLANPSWSQVVAFLWKLRRGQTNYLLKNGDWWFRRQEQNQYQYMEPRPFRPQPLSEERRLADLLLPDTVTGIPKHVVITLLATFLLLVAPGDYYLLGYFRARRYTWLLFLVVSLAFTWFTVRLAADYMSATDFRSALVFVDWTGQEKPARISRYELVFAATQKTIEEPLTDELHVAIPPNPSGTEYIPGNPMTDWDDEFPDWFGTDLPPPAYEGAPPRAFIVNQEMPKWTPRISRRTQFAVEFPAPPIDWSAASVENFKTEQGRANFVSSVRRAIPNAVVTLMSGTDTYEFALPEGGDPQRARVDPAGTADEQEFDAASPQARAQEIVRLAQQVSRRETAGLFQVISRLSPNGHRSFEDLSLVDPSDPSQWLVLIVTRNGDDYVVHRRLFEDARSHAP